MSSTHKSLAKTGIGIQELFETATTAALMPRGKREPMKSKPPTPNVSPNSFATDLGAFVDNMKFSDLEFRCKDGSTLFAHQIILRCSGVVIQSLIQAGSEIFMDLVVKKQKNEIFVDVFPENGRQIVYLAEEFQRKDITPVLEFLYSGNFNTSSKDDISSVSNIANKLKLLEMEQLCSFKLEKEENASKELQFHFKV